jgi:hypothetical protein
MEDEEGLRSLTIILVLILFIKLIHSGAWAQEEPIDLFSTGDESAQYDRDGTSYTPEPAAAVSYPGERQAGFNAYMVDTGIWYSVQWAARMYWVRDKSLKIFNTSWSKWWDNITTKPVWDDGDSFVVNWIAHPFFGMLSYQFYRTRGHNRWASALGSVIQSTLFEYAIEGLAVEPSAIDLVVTPALGVPLGIAMEELSGWLIKQDGTAAKVGAYVTNPMRLFVEDRQIGIVNPVAGTFEFKGPITIGHTKEVALNLGYPLYFESPLPLGRVMADLEVVDLKKDFGDQIFFYSIRLDLPNERGNFGLYIDAPYGGINNVNEEEARNGYEFSNITIGGKYVLGMSSNYALTAGLEVVLPTAFTDSQGRLNAVTVYRRDLPTYIYKAFTATPFISGALWKDVFSLQGSIGSDFIFNAENFQDDSFEFRIDYSTAAGVNVPIQLITPTVFVEFDGYTITTDDTNSKTDLFVTPGIRFGERFSPGFSVQFPVSGPTSDIAKVDYIFDFQLRF